LFSSKLGVVVIGSWSGILNFQFLVFRGSAESAAPAVLIFGGEVSSVGVEVLNRGVVLAGSRDILVVDVGFALLYFVAGAVS